MAASSAPEVSIHKYREVIMWMIIMIGGGGYFGGGGGGTSPGNIPYLSNITRLLLL